MPVSNIHIANSTEEFYRLAADHFILVVGPAVAAFGRALVVLSGGSTPAGLFSLLMQEPYRQRAPWQKIHFFWADERCVPPEHPESNYGQAKKFLLDHIPVPAGNVHPVNGSLAPQDAAEQYRQEILKFSTDGKSAPHFDWVLLGMGSDGHTASLFPGQPVAGPEEWTRAVKAQYEDRPSRRVTMTETVFNQALQLLFLVRGESKAAMVRRVLRGSGAGELLPAQRVKPADERVTWILDREAGAELRQI